MDGATEYAQQVVEKKIPACRFVHLACERHLRDLGRVGDPDFPYYFEPKKAERFFKFCSYLRHYKGPDKGKRLVLEPWQQFVFGSIYGWLNVHNDTWRFHYVYVEVPRKNGKTTMAAAGAAYDCAFMEDTGAEVYIAATKEDQAKLMYNDCLAYIGQSQELQEEFEVLTGKTTVYASHSHRTSWIKPLGSDSKRHDGLNPISVYTDELHAWPKRELWDVLEDAFGARELYHMIAITTAGHNKHGVCFNERKHLIQVLEQNIDAEDKFGIIYTVDEEDLDDWDKEEVWHKANPNLGCGKQLDYMRSQFAKAKQMPSKLNTVLNKQLNVWTDVEQAWLRSSTWESCAANYTAEELVGKQCTGGLDLARVGDLSAVSYYFPAQEGLQKPRLVVDFFIPKEGLRNRMDKDGMPWDQWAKMGYVTLTPGKTTDWDFIEESIKVRNGMFNLTHMGYDRYFAGELIAALSKSKINLEGFGMGFISMAAPTDEMERLVVSGQLQHPNNPVLNWNVANTVVVEDPAGNKKPDKQRSEDKIDGVTATIIAMGVHLSGKTKSPPSPYKKRGMRSL